MVIIDYIAVRGYINVLNYIGLPDYNDVLDITGDKTSAEIDMDLSGHMGSGGDFWHRTVRRQTNIQKKSLIITFRVQSK